MEPWDSILPAHFIFQVTVFPSIFCSETVQCSLTFLFVFGMIFSLLIHCEIVVSGICTGMPLISILLVISHIPSCRSTSALAEVNAVRISVSTKYLNFLLNIMVSFLFCSRYFTSYRLLKLISISQITTTSVMSRR